MTGSKILEFVRTELLAEDASKATIDFTSGFIDDIIKIVVRIIDRDPGLIRKFLKDRPFNCNAEEAKDNEDEAKWSPKGLIPLIFKRLTVHVPRHCFTYNEFLELVKAICIQNDAKEFVQEQGIEVLDAIYTARKDLPFEFQDDQRIFYRILSLDHETFTNIKRYLPSLLSTL